MLITQIDKDYAAEQAKIARYAAEKAKVIRRRREIQIVCGPRNGPKKEDLTKRGSIDGFSQVSGKRLRRYIDNYREDFCGMVTLTWGEEWPHDGRIVKAQMNKFWERLRRIGWLEEHVAVWWLEFQERGAPHIHMVVTGWLSRHWVALNWSECTGGDPSACSRVESLRDADGIGAYASKYAAKAEQKEVPEGFARVGRMWGVRGGTRARAEGRPSVPKMTAAIKIEALGRLWGLLVERRPTERAVYGLVMGCRAIRHEGGWSFYGTVARIEALMEEMQSWGMVGTTEN